MRTIIYARYSSHLQNSRSIEDQIAILRERCEREAWSIVGVYTDAAISGAAGIEARPGLEAALAAIDAGQADQLLAEATDRIARHQGDAFAIRERIAFAGGRIFTLSDGVVDDITGTIKGLFDSRFRKELAAKIKRGQRGTVTQGRVPAGLAFGYRVANRLDGKGGLVRGLREIVPEEAAIVLRIFAEYAAGQSPRAIAAKLNGERIPGPRGRAWLGSTINGDRVRGNGMLQNRLYAGEIVHNRTSKIIDPRTRKTLIRGNPEADWIVESAPQLRIIPPDLWGRVQQLRRRFAGQRNRTARRPKHLLSGLLRCGVCGGGVSVIASGRWGCGRYRDGRACLNDRQIETSTLESRVLAGLKEKILHPQAIAMFVREYTVEHGRVRRELARDRTRLERSVREAEAKMSNLVAAIAAGGDFEEIRAALDQARQDKAAAELAAGEIDAEESVVRLHPRLADQYREFVDQLLESLQDPEQRVESVPMLRSLIDRIVLTPKAKGRGCEVSLEGRLSNLLAAATGRAIDPEPTVADERVKGTRRKHRFLRAKV